MPEKRHNKAAALRPAGQKPPSPDKVEDLIARAALPKRLPRGEWPVPAGLAAEGSLSGQTPHPRPALHSSQSNAGADDARLRGIRSPVSGSR